MSNRNDSGLSRKRTVSAAERMVKEGGKSYEYGWLDKVLAVRENDKKIASFDYQVDGQIAQAIHGDQSEEFFWDSLALIHRGETSFVNEPYVTGGNPILSSKDGVMFNDMLGSTLNIGGKAIHMTAFGETKDTDALFTGKPYIGELGYAFLFRNYRADKGKWNSQDPIALAMTLPSGADFSKKNSSAKTLGYPDGWNNLAYVNNSATEFIDMQGCDWVLINTIGVLPHPTSPTYTPATPGSYTSPLGHILLHYTYIAYNYGNPTVTGTPPENPQDGSTYTEILTYRVTVTTYTWTEWEDPTTGVITNAKSGLNYTITYQEVTIQKVYVYRKAE